MSEFHVNQQVNEAVRGLSARNLVRDMVLIYQSSSRKGSPGPFSQELDEHRDMVWCRHLAKAVRGLSARNGLFLRKPHLLNHLAKAVRGLSARNLEAVAKRTRTGIPRKGSPGPSSPEPPAMV